MPVLGIVSVLILALGIRLPTTKGALVTVQLQTDPSPGCGGLTWPAW